MLQALTHACDQIRGEQIKLRAHVAFVFFAFRGAGA